MRRRDGEEVMVDETDDNIVDEMVDDSERVVVVPVQSSSYDPS